MRECPKCDKPTYDGTRCSSCNFVVAGAKPEPKAPTLDRNQCRCAFEIHGRRCRYIGAVSDLTRGATTWLCRGHFQTTGSAAVLTLEQSETEVKDGADYTAANTVRISRLAYLARPTGQ